jgi:UDP-N-acetylglucosamine 2-epimerase (non-hydrolysing)
MKVLVVYGTRPEAIKMCPLILELKNRPEVESIVCITGQHREMLDQVNGLFGVKADYDLNIMQERQSLADITTKVLQGVSLVLDKEKPDIMLVHGDTTTSFAAALAAFYKNIPVGHVEAGLRTYDMQSPFPEEFNRQVVDLICSYYFVPTETARKHLLDEGKEECKIYITGNTVIDALKITVDNSFTDDNIEWANDSRLVLLTSHRRENIGRNMKQIFQAVSDIVHEYQDVKVIYPVHKNPKVREIASQYFNDNDRVRLIEPLDVYQFHNYIQKCYLIMTDSGGIQEEAPSLGKPVLVLRENTERPEGIAAGTLKLVGVNKESVYRGVKELLDDKNLYESMSKASNPYGDGKASRRIVDVLLKVMR